MDERHLSRAHRRDLATLLDISIPCVASQPAYTPRPQPKSAKAKRLIASKARLAIKGAVHAVVGSTCGYLPEAEINILDSERMPNIWNPRELP